MFTCDIIYIKKIITIYVVKKRYVYTYKVIKNYETCILLLNKINT